jgi:cytochrome c oxidase cbb3-type subunit 4
MDMGTVRGLITLAVLVLFVGLWAWSWSRKRQPEYDAAAELPLQDDDGQLPGNEFGKERNA